MRKNMQKYSCQEGQGQGKHQQSLDPALRVKKISKIFVGNGREESQDAMEKSFVVV